MRAVVHFHAVRKLIARLARVPRHEMSPVAFRDILRVALAVPQRVHAGAFANSMGKIRVHTCNRIRGTLRGHGLTRAIGAAACPAEYRCR
jgi:hypothetical protein